VHPLPAFYPLQDSSILRSKVLGEDLLSGSENLALSFGFGRRSGRRDGWRRKGSEDFGERDVSVRRERIGDDVVGAKLIDLRRKRKRKGKTRQFEFDDEENQIETRFETKRERK